MRFTRLRLNGFKSFVDPTDLRIEEGLTGVVGPNGCGKSNLLEALRWVMGETRPTAMRGGGMEDVIFAGAASRPARGWAEVGLTLDNEARTAPAAFNAEDRLEVTRRITRDVGSDFRINGRVVRARDVGLLFADAATGSTSPALVRQGQIAELIAAKPAQRRRVLEDAAGIAGLHQRRHEAELRLRATAANLDRVEDLANALDAQLAGLARQARAAARYREVSDALRRAEALLLWRRWREAEDAWRAAEDALRAALGATAGAERAAGEAGRRREGAEAALPPAREEAAIAGALLQRVELAAAQADERRREAEGRVRGIERRLAQAREDADREAALDRDAAESLAALEAEARELDAPAAGEDAAIEAARAAAGAAGAALEAAEAEQAAASEALARLMAEHAAIERALREAAERQERAARDRDRAAGAEAEAGEEATRAAAALRRAEEAAAGAEARAAEAEAALARAEAARGEAREAEARSRADRAAADGAASALRAEADALTRALEAGGGRDGGGILDAVEVEPGFEAALGAALGEALEAGILDCAAGEGERGWMPLPGPAGAGPPAGAEPLARHVTAPEALTRALAAVGVADDATEAEQAALRPGQALVSRAGALWRWDGWQAGPGGAASAAARRLKTRNRLTALGAALEAAEAEAREAGAAHDAHAGALAAARDAEEAARAARRDADRALAEAGRARSAAEAASGRAAAGAETARAALARAEQEADAAAAAREAAGVGASGLPPLDAARAARDRAREAAEAARAGALAARAEADRLVRDAEARRARAARVASEIDGWRGRRASTGGRLDDLRRRVAAAEADLERARAVPGTLEAQAAKLSDELARARTRQAAAGDALARAEAAEREARAAERSAEAVLGEAREGRARAEMREDAARLAAAATREAAAGSGPPEGIPAAQGAEPGEVPPAAALEAEAAALTRRRDAIGPVNLRAEEDAASVREEAETLAAERADLGGAVEELRAGIASLNREGRSRLRAAFDEVNGNFGTLFRHLFGGGEARLALVESDDPLEAGLEIMCQPPGKRLSTLSLLSGGEQTLTALALIFAVFLANPSPICVLDEVDAPLDDANVGRFCDLLDEMTRRTETRFLIITHHAVTMARMDRLYGVTMVEQGVSQLVSVDLRAAEEMVA
jgi:chromosome segregation protein